MGAEHDWSGGVGASHGHGAVSYTHLDVYKRQPSSTYFPSRQNFLLPYHMLATSTTEIQTHQLQLTLLHGAHTLNMADQSSHFTPVLSYPTHVT